PPAPPAGDEGGLVVRLLWSDPVDLDLYVTTPRGETIYYANPGGVFVRDARCADGTGATHVEEARWRMPEPGRYRIGVDFPGPCTEGIRAAPYRLAVDAGGRRLEQTGTARWLVREPSVMGIDVP